MATITVTTSLADRQQVLDTLKLLEGQELSLSTLATECGLKQSKVRYVMADLLESGCVRREVVKAFNVHYVRYRYYVVKTKAV